MFKVEEKKKKEAHPIASLGKPQVFGFPALALKLTFDVLKISSNP